MKRLHLFLIILLAVGVSARPASAQDAGVPPIGTIEIYGLRTLDEAAVRAALPFKEGDHSLPQLQPGLGAQLAGQLGVAQVLLDGTCCDESGGVLVFVGIAEEAAPGLAFRPAPAGTVRLPDDIYQAFLDFNAAIRRASLSGYPTEDLSAGHALISDPAARAIQERFLGFAAERLDVIRAVLRDSADANHRAAAAYVIGYAPDKRDVTPDLVAASLDPFSSVRTNATRALTAIAMLAAREPERGIEIPPGPFIDMINSIVYEERSRGVAVLRRLSAGLDPAVLAELQARALPALIEMSRWSYTGHSYAPYQILGRVMGLLEEEIDATFDNGRKVAIELALTRLE